MTIDFKAFIDAQIAARPTENRILRKVVKALEGAGHPVVKVFDGEEYEKVSTLREIQEQVFNLDDAYLITASGSWVRLVLGNEWDVICDYTTNLEGALEPVNAYIDEHAN